MSPKMSNRIATLFALTIGVIAVAGFTSAQAGDQPNIIIMGEDADRDTVPRHNRVFNQVIDALVNEFNRKGFQAFNETAVALGFTSPSNVRRSDAALITIARRVNQVPLDVIVAFQIYAKANQNIYQKDIFDLDIRVRGRMLQIRTGRNLGTFNVRLEPRDLQPIPLRCKNSRDCILEHVGNQASQIAGDVAGTLAARLAAMSPARGATMTTTRGADMSKGSKYAGRSKDAITPAVECTGLRAQYALSFRGFEPDEITRIEEEIVQFRGFIHMRLNKATAAMTEYWFDSCTANARINRNLRLVIRGLGMEGRIGFRGNRFEIDKIAAPIIR